MNSVVPFDLFSDAHKIPAPKQRKIRSLVGPSPEQKSPAEGSLSYAEKMGQLPAGVISPTWDTEKKRPRSGFRHQGRIVRLGEIIECDANDAQSMVNMNKAEFCDE